jgi:hypothetical protein
MSALEPPFNATAEGHDVEFAPYVWVHPDEEQ